MDAVDDEIAECGKRGREVNESMEDKNFENKLIRTNTDDIRISRYNDTNMDMSKVISCHICIYIHIYLYIYIHTYVYIYIYIYIYVYIYVHIYTCVLTNACIYTYLHRYIQIFKYLFIYIFKFENEYSHPALTEQVIKLKAYGYNRNNNDPHSYHDRNDDDGNDKCQKENEKCHSKVYDLPQVVGDEDIKVSLYLSEPLISVEECAKVYIYIYIYI
jgi:hypothetical protein